MAVAYGGTIPAPWAARATVRFDPTDQNYIANQVARPIGVEDKAGTLPYIGRQGMVPDGTSSKRAPGSAYQRDDLQANGTAYECLSYGREGTVPVEVQKRYQSIMNVVALGAMKARGKLAVDREIRIENLIINTTTFTGAALYKDYKATPWSTAGTDVLAQIRFAKDAMRSNSGMQPNAVVMGRGAMNNLKFVNSDIQDRLKYVMRASPGIIEAQMADLFEVKYIIVGDAIYDSGNEEDDDITGTDIWGDDYVQVCRIAETDDPEENCISRIINWQAMGAGTDSSVGYYNEQQTKSTIVQVDQYSDELIIDTKMGFLLRVET